MEDKEKKENKIDDFSHVTMLDQISISVTSPKQYKHLVKLRTGRLVWFIVLVTFIFAFIEFGIEAIAWVGKVGGFKKLAMEVIPPFTYEDEALSMEQDYQLDIGDIKLYINTEDEEVSLKDMDVDGVYVTIGSKSLNMGIVSNGMTYTYMEMPVKYLIFSNSFDNESLAALSPLFYAYIIFMFVCVMVSCAVRHLMLALILSLVVNGVANRLHTGLTYGKVFAVCVYSLTLVMFVMSVNMAMGVILPSFAVWMLGMFVAMMYANKAIISMSNLDVPPGSFF